MILNALGTRGLTTVNGRWIVAAVFALTGAAATAPAAAQSVSAQTGRALADWELSGWTVGGMAFSGGEAATPTVSGLHDKQRGGPGLALSSLGEGVTLRSWAAGSEISGAASGGGGLLLDVPLGGFTFTPSFGAVRGESLSVNGAAATALRSQLEIGYNFDNASRLSFGYSRLSGLGGDTGRLDGDVVSLSYRLPFGALLNW